MPFVPRMFCNNLALGFPSRPRPKPLIQASAGNGRIGYSRRTMLALVRGV